MKSCKTPHELIEYVSKMKDVIRLQETFRGKVHDQNEEQILNNPLIYKRSIPAYMYLYHFMNNHVPTDLYRVKNPKLEVSADEHLIKTPNTVIEEDEEEEPSTPNDNNVVAVPDSD